MEQEPTRGGRAIKKGHGKPDQSGISKRVTFSGHFRGRNEGGNYREIFTVHFFAFFGHVGAGGAQMTENNIFCEDFAC